MPVPGNRYYDPDGNPISMEEWATLFEMRADDDGDESWWRKKTVLPNATISTVWLGLDHSFISYGEHKPLTWETMVFSEGGDLDQQQWRYTTREEAFSAHDEIVKYLEGQSTNEVNQQQ